MRRPTIDDAYTLDSGHMVIQEGNDCAICGEPFEVGQKAIEVPFDDESKWVTTGHLGCAINGDEVDL